MPGTYTYMYFRKQNNIDWDLCYKLCLEGIDRYRKKWTSKEKVSLSTLNEWTVYLNVKFNALEYAQKNNTEKALSWRS